MEFWIFFVCVCIGFVFLERLVAERYKKFVPMVLMFFITFISAFRYRIGWDYQSYETMFYTTQIEDVYPEVTFRLLSNFLRDCGFDFQVIFIVYSLLTSIFIWRGLRYYFSNNTNKMIMSIASYALIKGLYWESFSQIRQSLAGAIFFFGCKFIIERNFIKYLMVIFVATLIHFSCVILIFCYFIPIRYESNLKHIALVAISIIVAIFKIPQIIVSFIFSYAPFYSYYIDGFSVGWSLVVQTLLWGGMILLTSSKYKKDQKQLFSLNSYTLGITIMWLLSFSEPLHRVVIYLQMFQTIQTVYFVYSFKNNCRIYMAYIILLIYLMLLLQYINLIQSASRGIQHSYISANNINYTFNFKLFQ